MGGGLLFVGWDLVLCDGSGLSCVGVVVLGWVIL